MTYKKKRGRKKKRGPKKRKPEVVRTYVGLDRPYHVITTSRGIQLEDIYTAVTFDKALERMRSLQAEYNKDIQFPVRFIASKKGVPFEEADYRLMIIKYKEDDDIVSGKVRNEYGKYIDCVTDNEYWVFMEDAPYQVEETFWIYGFNPKRERKTFSYIIDEMISYKERDKYYHKQIAVFKNKLIISSTDKTELIMCKNHIDSVRLYNEIYNKCEERKYKYVSFAGDIKVGTVSFSIWYDKIRDLTGWTYKRIMRNGTRD